MGSKGNDLKNSGYPKMDKKSANEKTDYSLLSHTDLHFLSAMYELSVVGHCYCLATIGVGTYMLNMRYRYSTRWAEYLGT